MTSQHPKIQGETIALIKEIAANNRLWRAERIQGELLHILILSETQLRRVLKEYALYFNSARPHQGIDQQLPEPKVDRSDGDEGRVVAFPVLGGLHHDYRRAA